jgi:hypothetical protein
LAAVVASKLAAAGCAAPSRGYTRFASPGDDVQNRAFVRIATNAPNRAHAHGVPAGDVVADATLVR